MNVTADLPGGATVYERDPRAYEDAAGAKHETAMMGDIVRTTLGEVTLRARVESPGGLERLEIRSGKETLATYHPYDHGQLGRRIRVTWAGADYRGRGRDTSWVGQATFANARIDRFETINLWNPEQMLEQRGSRTVSFRTVTTGNFMGFDAWVSGAADGALEIDTNHGKLMVTLDEIGLEPVVMEAGGLERRLMVQRLPDAPLPNRIEIAHGCEIAAQGDTPLWIAVTTEDGYQAWSSPIYLFRESRAHG